MKKKVSFDVESEIRSKLDDYAKRQNLSLTVWVTTIEEAMSDSILLEFKSW